MQFSIKKLETKYTDELLPFTFNQTGMMFKNNNYILHWEDNNHSGKVGFHTDDNGDIFLQSCLVDFGNSFTFASIIKYLFKNYKPKRINCHYSLYNFFANLHQDHNFSIELPKTFDELIAREPRKKRYNLKRERRILSELGVRFEEIQKSEFDNAVSTFFEYKKITHNRNWNMTPTEFLQWLNITNIYALKKDTEYIAFALSDEHFPKIIFQQTAYNPIYEKYSPGSVMYVYFLQEMISKKYTEIFLGGGGHEYKRMFGSREDFTFNGYISKHYILKGLYMVLRHFAAKTKHSILEGKKK